MKHYNDFTLLIKMIRAQAGISMRELSSGIGLSVGYLCDIENGNRPPIKSVVNRLIQFYNLDEDDKRKLYDAAASVTGTLPYDVEDYLLSHPDELRGLIEKMQEEQRNV